MKLPLQAGPVIEFNNDSKRKLLVPQLFACRSHILNWVKENGRSVRQKCVDDDGNAMAGFCDCEENDQEEEGVPCSDCA
jgi:hypothetical protein